MAANESTPTQGPGVQKLPLVTLTAMVVGSMVGAGVFSLPARFSSETGIAGALVAWAIAGTGMLMLAFVFQTLAIRKPKLDAGVYAYAKAGFGEYLGFFSAFGYWTSACVGNVTYWVLIMSTVGGIIPGLGAGDTVLAVLASTAGVWVFYWLIRRGVREAALLNRIVTIAKVVPILVFILLALFVLDTDVFAANFRTGGEGGWLFEQVRGTMLVTVFVFLGLKEPVSTHDTRSDARTSVGPQCSASSACSLSSPRSPSCPTGCCPRPNSPSCASRRWPACWRRRSVDGAACSSASA